MNGCKLINIVWVDRGIILSIITYIIKLYHKISYKKIIINNKNYRQLLRKIFPDLSFTKFTKFDDDNFYFNTRTMIKKQNIIIDYLHNYDDYVPTTKIQLVPWYDINDPLVIYEFSNNDHVDAMKYKHFIKQFSLCRRGNYFGYPWDLYMETYIFIRYQKFMNINNINNIITLFNSHLINNYTDTVVYFNVIYPYSVNQQNQINELTDQNHFIDVKQLKNVKPSQLKMIGINNENSLAELMKLMSNKISNTIKILQQN